MYCNKCGKRIESTAGICYDCTTNPVFEGVFMIQPTYTVAPCPSCAALRAENECLRRSMKLDAATMDAKDTRIAELEYQNKSMEKYVTEGIAFRDDLQVRCATLEQAIKKIYTTQMYEDRTKELGVGVEMVGAILEAAEKAGCRI